MQPVRFSHSQRWTCVLRFNHSPFFDAWIVNNSIFRSINVRERLSKYNSVSGHKALCASAISASWCTKPGLCGSMQEKCILELHFTQSNSLLNPLGSFLEFGIFRPQKSDGFRIKKLQQPIRDCDYASQITAMESGRSRQISRRSAG